MAALSESQIARNRLARLYHEGHSADSPEVIAARQEMRDLKLEAAVRKVIAQAKPLSQETRSRLALLLQDDDPTENAAPTGAA